MGKWILIIGLSVLGTPSIGQQSEHTTLVGIDYQLLLIMDGYNPTQNFLNFQISRQTQHSLYLTPCLRIGIGKEYGSPKNDWLGRALMGVQIGKNHRYLGWSFRTEAGTIKSDNDLELYGHCELEINSGNSLKKLLISISPVQIGILHSFGWTPVPTIGIANCSIVYRLGKAGF